MRRSPRRRRGRRRATITASPSAESEAVESGSLTVTGTGIQPAAHLTTEGRLAVQRADEVLYITGDQAAVQWLERVNRNARSLNSFYEPGKPRLEIYESIVEEIVSRVRDGVHVCVVLYGHPGVFAWPGHEAVRRLRDEGFRARMLPGISTLDCLVADLGLDPAPSGCQSYEATDFLVRPRSVDPGALLILWQIGFIGRWDYEQVPSMRCLPLLVERLLELYPAEHEVILYEASPYPVCDPVVVRLPLEAVPDADFSPIVTMVIPPSAEPVFDQEMLERVTRQSS